MKLKMWIGIPISWGFGLVAQAHEGHGVAGQGHTLRHQLLEPAHWPGVLVGLLVVTLLVWTLGRFWKRATQFQERNRIRFSREAD